MCKCVTPEGGKREMIMNEDIEQVGVREGKGEKDSHRNIDRGD